MRLTPFHRRMMPLYIAKFLRNIVFWYAVEKLFMVSIGFTSETIGLMVAVYAAMSVLMEVPSGVLADRWSRKGVLALAGIALTISSLIGGMSTGIILYIASAIFWGFYDALASGTDDAIIYDTLVEEYGNADKFEKEYGIYQAIGGGALFVAGITGGLIGHNIDLRADYYLTIPFAVAATIVVLFYRDTTVHRASQEANLKRHLHETFSQVFRNPNLIWILVTMFSIGLANGLVGEMHQLWYIAIAAPVLFFGLAGALINSTWGFGGLLVRFLTRQRILVASIVILLISSIVLIITRNSYVIIGTQFVFMILANAVFAAMMAQMHRRLPSRVRAGAGSAANTVARLINIPLVLGFGIVAHTHGIFAAGWILATLIIIGLISELHVHIRRKAHA